MLTFDYYSPVRVHFQEGACSRIGDILKGKYKKVLLVCGKGPFRANGVYEEVKTQLELAGAEVLEMEDVDSNPRLHSVRTGATLARTAGADCVAALGGGSAMDASKLIAVSAKTGIDPYRYVWGDRVKAEDSLDTVMIPTIAATGTELNDTAVIVDEETREKYWCVCKYPAWCILDPCLTLTLPGKLTVWGAMDVLSHTFEYYFNGCRESEFQLCFSEALMISVMRALEKLVINPLDCTARGELLWCSAVTWGTGLTKIGRGEPDMACHSIEESFSGYFDTHHGGCLGVLTPRWMRFAAERKPWIFARFARNVMGVREKDDVCGAGKGVDEYIKWLKGVGGPQTYSDLSDNVSFDDAGLNTVRDHAWRIYKGRIGRLCPMTEEEVLELLMEGKRAL